MSLGERITHIMNGTIEAIKGLIPIPVVIDKPTRFTAPHTQSEIGVLIGVVGDIRGRIVIEGPFSSFGGIGETMFGMTLEGEMLESFTGELGNMIAGSLATIMSQKGVIIDITPPTVLVGQTKLYGFSTAFRLPVNIEGKGSIQIILIIEDK